MKELYSHKVVTSFYLWFDHMLLNQGQAFQNVDSSLYRSADHRVPGSLVPFASPYRQWVYDSSVLNAQVPTGFWIDGIFQPRASDVRFDFDNGRILLGGSAMGGGGPDGNVVSGSYSRKEFNTYVVASEDSKLIFEQNYDPVSAFNIQPESGANPFGYGAPAAFIMNTLTDNKPFAFGGEQETTNKIRVVLVTDDVYALDGCISMFRDLSNSIIPLCNVNDAPFNEYGDLKSGLAFNYSDLAEARKSRYLFIDKVSATKTTTVQQNKNNPNLRYGIIDFYLSEPRVPKLDL